MNKFISYQDEQSMARQPSSGSSLLAVVASVEPEGVRIQIDGEDRALQKLYKVNPEYLYQKGQRILVQKISGSYFVICPVGYPRME